MVFSWRAQHYATLAEARAREASAAALQTARVAADSRAATAIATAEAGEVDRGLFGLIDALELAPPGGAADRDRREALGRNISAWMAVLPVLRHTIDGVTPETRLLFTGPDRTVATLVDGNRRQAIRHGDRTMARQERGQGVPGFRARRVARWVSGRDGRSDSRNESRRPATCAFSTPIPGRSEPGFRPSKAKRSIRT